MSTIRNRSSRKSSPTKLAASPPKASQTKQEFKTESDINVIVARAMRGQAPTWLNTKVPQYSDVSGVPDLHSAYEMISQAEESFMTLPAALRRELGNDPANITQLTRDMATRHGLLKSPPQPLESSPEATGGPGGGTPPETQQKPSKGKKSASTESNTQE